MEPWRGPNTNRERKPMRPAELDALRPRPKPQAAPVDEAKQVAYRSGIAEIELVMRRLITAEKNIAELMATVQRLESELLAARCEFR